VAGAGGEGRWRQGGLAMFCAHMTFLIDILYPALAYPALASLAQAARSHLCRECQWMRSGESGRGLGGG
jgi:hypothetical protein